MSRAVVYTAVVVVVLGGAVLAGMALRDRGGLATVPSAVPTATVPSAAATAVTTASASPTPSPASRVLGDDFGLYVFDGRGKAIVRSETSFAEIDSLVPNGRSFVSLSRMVSPDGRSIAYWEPAAPSLHVRSASGGNDKIVLTGAREMSGNAFTWSSDGAGLVAALDNNCQEMCPGPHVAELWTVDLPSGATERIASGQIWVPVAWDRGAKLVAAGVTGPGGYLGGYDLIDLRQRPYAVRSTSFAGPTPYLAGGLKASPDARYAFVTDGGPIEWWPLAEPSRRATIPRELAARSLGNAAWRPGTGEIWWVGALSSPGCETSSACTGTEIVSFDVMSGVRTQAFRGTCGAYLIGFRPDGSAAVTASRGLGVNASDLTLVETATGWTANIAVSGSLGASVRIR